MHNLFFAKDASVYAHYVIDGVRHDATPFELLQECMAGETSMPSEVVADIVDESLEPPLTSFTYENGKYQEYGCRVQECKAARGSQLKPFKTLYPEHQTKLQIACSLIDRIWQKGHFRVGDLKVALGWYWHWDSKPLGSMAAFYASAQAACEYVYDLGLELAGFTAKAADSHMALEVSSFLAPDEEFEQGIAVPYSTSNPWIEDSRAVPETPSAKHGDAWVIFIPFDTCSFKVGGSLLAEAYGHNGGPAPSIQDPDYFIDCYEVVRELVEDRIVLAGCTVGEGGLMTAASRLAGKFGMDMDIKGLMASYQTEDSVKMLFGEVPGVVLMIQDKDFDYVDSQFLLQDVAYYPVGRLSDEHKGIILNSEPKSGLADILASLMAQASEGED